MLAIARTLALILQMMQSLQMIVTMTYKGSIMQWRHIEDNWDVFKVIIKQHWHKVDGQQLDKVEGKRARLSKLIEATYGVSRFHAEQQLCNWQDSKINIDGHFYTAETQDRSKISELSARLKIKEQV